MRAAHFVTSVLIDPFRDPQRAKILLAGSLGSFGVCLLALALSYTIASQSLTQNLLFQIPRQVLTGVIGIPISLWLGSKSKGALRVFLFQSLGIVFFAADMQDALACAIGYALITGPFWANYNMRFAKQQSRTNNARETALGQVVLVLASAIGIWMGGFLLQIKLYEVALVCGISTIFIATWCLFEPYQADDFFPRIWNLIKRRKPSVRLSLYNGFLSTIQDSSACLIIWFKMMDISPLATGTILSIQPILGLFFAPFIGHWVQKSTLSSVRLGGMFNLVGWLGLCLAQKLPWFLTPTLGILSIATNLIGTAECVRWYKLRSPVGIAARENLLGIGRGLSFAVALPLAFLVPLAYPVGGIALSLLFIFGIQARSKDSRKK